MEADEGLQRMAELGEILVRERKPGMVVMAGGDIANAGVLAKDWVGEFVRHHLIDPKPDTTTKSKAIAVGKVLSAYLDRTLMVDAAGQSWAVTMRKRPGSSGGKTYYFAEIEQVAERGDAPAGADDTLRIVEVAEAAQREADCAAVIEPNATPTATPIPSFSTSLIVAGLSTSNSSISGYGITFASSGGSSLSFNTQTDSATISTLSINIS
jgi:hypothetical protein